jgi:hypothetical protein
MMVEPLVDRLVASMVVMMVDSLAGRWADYLADH